MRHIYREANFSADALTLLGRSLSLGSVLFEDPPPELSSLFVRDSWCCN